MFRDIKGKITESTIFKEIQENMIKYRRHLHQFPELAHREFLTTDYICNILKAFGYDLILGNNLYDENCKNSINKLIGENIIEDEYKKSYAKIPDSKWISFLKGGLTGVIASIKSSKPGPRIGFRFDIDGLNIKESNEPGHKPYIGNYASQNQYMHGCGHDGHTAVGLGLAELFARNHNALKGEIYLLFQPAEEGGLGGQTFATHPIIKTLDYLIPIHFGIINERKIVCSLNFLANKTLRVSFNGKNAHASDSPERGNNALLSACIAAQNLYTLTKYGSRVLSLNVGNFHSYNSTSVISDKAVFDLGIRGETNELCEYLEQRVKNTLNGSAQIHNCST